MASVVALLLWLMLVQCLSRQVWAIRNLDESAAVSDKDIIPALVVFGDSTVDAGNNNYLKTIVKSNFRPYGLNFEGHVPTGRFTDGFLVTDYISMRVGIPMQLPYLAPEAHGEALLTGVNFASSASGWINGTSKLVNVKGLDYQMEWYDKWKTEVVKVAGPKKGNFIISQALYAISTGTNDWVNNYYVSRKLKSEYTPDNFITLLVGQVRKYTLEIYTRGGRNIVILGLPPIGCLPSQITFHGHGNKTCVEHLNDDARKMNAVVISAIADLNKVTPGARIVYVDIFNPIYNTFQDPQKYGFKYARDGCCGTGELEASVLCNRVTATICSNPAEHIFWDSFHPTSHFYSQLADYMYNLVKPILLAPPNP